MAMLIFVDDNMDDNMDDNIIVMYFKKKKFVSHLMAMLIFVVESGRQRTFLFFLKTSHTHICSVADATFATLDNVPNTRRVLTGQQLHLSTVAR